MQDAAAVQEHYEVLQCSPESLNRSLCRASLQVHTDGRACRRRGRFVEDVTFTRHPVVLQGSLTHKLKG